MNWSLKTKKIKNWYYSITRVFIRNEQGEILYYRVRLLTSPIVSNTNVNLKS
jgi:hypothetical protein